MDKKGKLADPDEQGSLGTRRDLSLLPSLDRRVTNVSCLIHFWCRNIDSEEIKASVIHSEKSRQTAGVV